MAWIESHQSLLTHRKTLRAAALLRIDRLKLIGHLHALWWWGLDNASDNGNLGKVLDEELSEAACWPVRQAERFVSALVEAGFLDRDGTRLALHDWWEYAGKLNAKRAKDRARKAEVAGNSSGIPAEVARKSQAPNQPNQPAAKAAIPTNQPDQPDQPAAAAAAFKSFEDCIGSLSAYMARKLEDDVTEFGENCVIHCLEEAAANGARNLKYAETIMRRHQTEGCYDDKHEANDYPTEDEVRQRVAWLAETRRQAV